MDFRKFIQELGYGIGHGWPNRKKRLEKHPDFVGYARMPEKPDNVRAGALMEIIGWVRNPALRRQSMRMRLSIIEDEEAFIQAEEGRRKREQEFWYSNKRPEQHKEES